MNWSKDLSIWFLVSILLVVLSTGCGAPSQVVIFDKDFTPYDGAGLRGLKFGQAKSAVEEGKQLAKEGEYEDAIILFRRAQKNFPDEDNLLLIAASLDKLNTKCEGEECSKRCADALMGWQRYLGNCKRCIKVKQRRKYRSYGQKKQAKLGAKCGGQIQLTSTPSKAWITIDNVRVGSTPQTLWLPVGERRYSLEKKTSKTQGTISVKSGMKRDLSLTLNNDTYQRVAKVKLKCKSQRCMGSLGVDDPYWLEVSVERESFIYIFAEAMGKITKIFPINGSNRASKGNSLKLPSIDTYTRSTSGQAELLHVFFADKPITSFTVNDSSITGEFNRYRQLATLNKSRGDQTVVEAKGSFSLLTIQLSDVKKTVALNSIN